MFVNISKSLFKNKLLYNFSIWQKVPAAPPDPVLGISEAFKKDTFPKKVNLGVGAYRDNNGKPWVLPSVRKAEELLFKGNLDNEYLPVEGLDSFLKGSARLAYTENNNALKEKRIAAVQSLSGTGAVRLGMELVKKYLPENTAFYLPKPTWPNHNNMCKEIGLNLKEYRYFDPSTIGLDIQGLLQDLDAAPNGSVFLFHACAHNPTGVDPTLEQWKQISQVVLSKKHVAFFDMAYQGFTSGDVDKDSSALRLFAENGSIPIMLAQSFAKNFGLYGQRIGMFSTICESEKEADTVVSQLKIVARRSYSNPPAYGARIVSTVLNTPELYTQWCSEVKTMADRIASMRLALVQGLKDAGSQRNWKHVTDQIGMFAFTGINRQQCELLASKHHVYLTMDGRISIAGLNTNNVNYTAQAFHDVTK